MKKYRVLARVISYVACTIEAEDMDAAFAIARETDGEMFLDTKESDWEICSVYETGE